LTIWKKSSQKPVKPEQTGKTNIYLELKKEIKPLREQGELPTKVPASFGRYYCDLCNSTVPVEELRQCSLCGRWVCNTCFTNEYYICNSCNGILKLYMTKE
jgi:hypothetical protein